MTARLCAILVLGSAMAFALAGWAFYGWQAGGLGLLQSALPLCS